MTFLKVLINTSKFLLSYENRSQWGDNINIEVELVSDSLVAFTTNLKEFSDVLVTIEPITHIV